MFANADSGLYLTMFRAYDPVTGRWLSRDPSGETSDSEGNLYAYVSGDPVQFSDPTGLQAIPIPILPPMPAPGCSPDTGGVPNWFMDLFNGPTFNRPKNPPDEGPENGWIEGPRRGREYGPDGLPLRDYDKPHQGNEVDHVHEWPGESARSQGALILHGPAGHDKQEFTNDRFL